VKGGKFPKKIGDVHRNQKTKRRMKDLAYLVMGGKCKRHDDNSI